MINGRGFGLTIAIIIWNPINNRTENNPSSIAASFMYTLGLDLLVLLVPFNRVQFMRVVRDFPFFIKRLSIAQD